MGASFSLVLGCGPVGDSADTEAGTETETGTAGTATETSGGPDGQPDDGADDGQPDDGADDGQPDDGADDGQPDDGEPDTGSDDDAETDDGTCPPGSEGCPCEVGAACDDGLMCNVRSGECIGEVACEEPEGEPNETEDSAVDLGEINCGDDPSTTSGALSGVDLDMFAVHGVDGFTCFSDPEIVVTADVPLRACVFFECDNGTASVDCPGNNEEATSPAGHPGCCGMSGAELSSHDCAGNFGNPDSGTIYARVSQGEDRVCTPYDLEYSF